MILCGFEVNKNIILFKFTLNQNLSFVVLIKFFKNNIIISIYI